MHPVGYGRWILEGFLGYADQQPSWQLRHEPNSDEPGLDRLLSEFSPDAILCESRNPATIDALVSWGKPVVFVAADLRQPGADALHRVRADNPAVGVLGFDHLHKRGFHRFLFAGFHQWPFSLARLQGYQAAAKRVGCEIEVLPTDTPPAKILKQMFQDDPRPAALFAARDGIGLEFVHAALAADIRVPEDLAVLGVDNEALLCRICHPALSSVDPGTERIGHSGAELLHALLRGEKVPPADNRIQPVRVVARASTDTLATQDPNLSRVYAFIREHACDEIRFEEIVRLSHMSRRSLETRYKTAFGFTLGEHITRVRVARARELLELTDMYTPDIAAECGWPSASHMCVMFKRHTRLTPSEYRRKTRRP